MNVKIIPDPPVDCWSSFGYAASDVEVAYIRSKIALVPDLAGILTREPSDNYQSGWHIAILTGATDESWFGSPPKAAFLVDPAGEAQFVAGDRNLAPPPMMAAAFGRHATASVTRIQLPDPPAQSRWEAREKELYFALPCGLLVGRAGLRLPGQPGRLQERGDGYWSVAHWSERERDSSRAAWYAALERMEGVR